MNKDIRFIVIFFFINAALMVWGYFSQKVFVPLTGNAHLLMGLVTFWAAARLFSAKNKDSATRTFSLFFFFFSMFMLFMTLPHLLLAMPDKYRAMFGQGMNWGYIIGHVFTYLSLAVFIRIPLAWTFPKLKNLGTAFFLLFGSVITFINIIRPNTPVFNTATGITLLNADPLVGKLIAIIAALAFVPAAVYFIIKGIRSKEGIVRGRALLFGIGLVVTTIGGPIHDVARQRILFLVADILALAGLCILTMGVFYKADLTARANPIK